MIVIEGYGVRLKRLEVHEIELVRYWRNNPSIKKFMEYREEITPEMQLSWFNALQSEKEFFFLIQFNQQNIGLINGSDTDWVNGVTGNGGIFIWMEEYWSTSVPFAAAVLLTEFSFSLGIKQSYAKILRDNYKSIQFNKDLGYRMLPNQEGKLNQQYVLEREVFYSTTYSSRKMLAKLHGNTMRFTLSGLLDSSELFLIERYHLYKYSMNSPFELVREN